MNCTNEKKAKVKAWVVFDAKTQKFHELTHKEFGNLLKDIPVKLVDKQIWNREKGKKVYIDGILNSSLFGK